MTASGLYIGDVMHRRLRPQVHVLRYRLFSLLLDLDEIDQLTRQLRLFSRNRFNIFSFRDADHGDGTSEPLRQQVEAHLRAAGIAVGGGAIRLLTMPRILGFAFNPISIYFCSNHSGAITAILYEVNNTFGQRHSYLLPVVDGSSRPFRQTVPKAFHVSPFMKMAMTYEFYVVPPGEKLAVSITGTDADGPIITAALVSKRHDLTDTALAKAFFTHPLLTFKVVAGILWEALLLWRKGISVHPLPVAPKMPVTYHAPDL